MENKDIHIETLLRLVSEGAGVLTYTPSAFQSIADFLELRTREKIGLTTIKRLWNYGGMDSSPRVGTLNILARSIGYRSFEDFCSHYGDCTPSSDIVLGSGIKVADLQRSDRVVLRWNPGREIVIDYLGNNTFRILKSEGSKLRAGDTFQATVFAIGHPAMLANVIHEGSSWPLYEVGQQGGLTWAQLLPQEGE